MLSSEHLIRDIVERFQHSAAYVAEEHVNRLALDIRAINSINWTLAKDLWQQRKADLVLAYGFPATERNMEKPFAFAEGLAFIPVHGMLLNRFSGSYGFATGYNFIRNQCLMALNDDDVQAIVYDYNTYGGTAAGCGELSKEMYDSRGIKPSLAVIDASCYSAGIFLASAQDQVIGSPSCGVGSIGCISMHVDLTEMLKDDGIKITFIRSAPRKMEGNPYEPLSDAAKKNIQASVDFHASAFIESVARNRNMAESDIRATDAACFDPPAALENGLIDAVQPPIEAISSFLGSLNGGSGTMQTNQNSGTAPLSAADIAKLVSDGIAAGISTALPTALAAHDKAKTERRAAIMGCEDAKKRQKLAASLADNTSMSVDEAKVILAAAAEEAPAAGNRSGRSPFHQAMDTTENPGVGGDGDGGGDGGEGGSNEAPMDAAGRILDLYASHTGNKVVPIKKRA